MILQPTANCIRRCIPPLTRCAHFPDLEPAEFLKGPRFVTLVKTQRILSAQSGGKPTFLTFSLRVERSNISDPSLSLSRSLSLELGIYPRLQGCSQSLRRHLQSDVNAVLLTVINELYLTRG